MTLTLLRMMFHGARLHQEKDFFGKILGGLRNALEGLTGQLKSNSRAAGRMLDTTR